MNCHDLMMERLNSVDTSSSVEQMIEALLEECLTDADFAKACGDNRLTCRLARRAWILRILRQEVVGK
jgi:hypothetical protein